MSDYTYTTSFPSNFIGFNDLFDGIQKLTGDAQSWPPYNIVKVDDQTLEIEMPLAGYERDDIEISFSEGILTVETKEGYIPSSVDKEFIYQGVTSRKFKRSFRINKGYEVKHAKYSNGMLKIEIHQVIPDEPDKKLISIE